MPVSTCAKSWSSPRVGQHALSKVILWVIVLAIGLMAYVTYTQLAPMDYPRQLRGRGRQDDPPGST
jgi:hypothetical protein